MGRGMPWLLAGVMVLAGCTGGEEGTADDSVASSQPPADEAAVTSEAAPEAAGDPVAGEAVDRACHYLAIATGSMINTFFTIPAGLIEFFLLLSTYLLAMGMAGLGTNIKWAAFAKVGVKSIAVGVIGFIGLIAITPVLLWIFRFFS